MDLVPGRSVVVRSPATSANLGPGFDCLGLALDLWDEYRAVVREQPGIRVVSIGEGAGSLPGDGTHLVARAMLAGLEHAGADVPGLELQCRNTIPHGRGLGSSSAAIVGGLALARALLGGGALPQEAMVSIANRIEGHPDNIAPAVLGGATIAWVDDGSIGRAVRIGDGPHAALTVLIPDNQAQTEAARGLLPPAVPYADAVFNLSRTALLVHALAGAPELLFAATEDRLHQDYRQQAYPASLAAVRALRARGFAAAVSGAGPAVVVFGDRDLAPYLPAGFRMQALRVSSRGAHEVA